MICHSVRDCAPSPHRMPNHTTPNQCKTKTMQESLTTASGLKIKKLVKGSGPEVETGDLVGVRFKGNYGSYEFDNIFTTAEPYYMRAGVGTLVKVRQTVTASGVYISYFLACLPYIR